MYRQVEREERADSQYEYLNLEGAQEATTYHSVGSLVGKVAVLCFSSFYFGYCLTAVSTFVNSTTFNMQISYGDAFYNLSEYNRSNGILMGVLPLGAMVGAGCAPLVMRVLSRKQFILSINILAVIIEGVLQVNNLIALLVCRIFQGVCVGFYMSIVPIYINELAPRQIIGSFGVATQLFVLVGVVVSYALSLILTAADASPQVFCRVLLLFNVLFILAQTALLLAGFIPESPNSLIKANRNDQAKAVIGLFTLQAYVDRTFKEKFMEVESEVSTQPDQAQTIKYSFKAYLLGFELPFMQQMTGINAIVTQANSIVEQIIPNLAPYVSIIINGVQLLFTVGAIWSIKRFGRRPINLFGNLGLAIVDIAIGILFVFSSWQGSGYFIFALLIVYMMIYGVSIGPSVWMYVPEIIPAKVVPLATMTNWFGCAICVIFTPYAVGANDGNPFPVFFFFGAITILFFIINVFLMVETKGRTTQQIAKIFAKEII